MIMRMTEEHQKEVKPRADFPEYILADLNNVLLSGYGGVLNWMWTRVSIKAPMKNVLQ